MARVHAIVLAAGRATRFGSHKLLLPAGARQTVIARSTSAALSGVDGEVVVVLGRDASAVRQAALAADSSRDAADDVPTRLRFVHNTRFEDGLGTSVASGVLALEGSLAAGDGAMLLLGDQPLVGEFVTAKLAQAFLDRGESVVAVAAASGGMRRNPVVVASELMPDLGRLTGDEGARSLLLQRRGQVVTVEFGEGPWSRDIDEWSQYARLAVEHGWGAERFPAPLQIEWSRLERQLRERSVYRLAPGVLFAALPGAVTGGTVHDSPGQLLWATVPADRFNPANQRQTLLVGSSAGVEEYLAGLRSAALWALNQTAAEPG